MADETFERQVLERLVRVEEGVRSVIQDVSEINLDLFGPPRDPSIHGRIHKLEGSNATATAATAALTIARDLHEKRIGRGMKTMLFLAAVLTLVCTVTTTVMLVAQAN